MESILNFIFDNLFFIIIAIIALRFFQKAKGTGKLSGKKFQDWVQKIEELNEEGLSERKETPKSSNVSAIPSHRVRAGSVKQTVEPGIKILIVILIVMIAYFVISQVL